MLSYPLFSIMYGLNKIPGIQERALAWSLPGCSLCLRKGFGNASFIVRAAEPQSKSLKGQGIWTPQRLPLGAVERVGMWSQRVQEKGWAGSRHQSEHQSLCRWGLRSGESTYFLESQDSLKTIKRKLKSMSSKWFVLNSGSKRELHKAKPSSLALQFSRFP